MTLHTGHPTYALWAISSDITGFAIDEKTRYYPHTARGASPIREAEERTKRQYEAEIERMKRELLDQNE